MAQLFAIRWLKYERFLGTAVPTYSETVEDQLKDSESVLENAETELDEASKTLEESYEAYDEAAEEEQSALDTLNNISEDLENQKEEVFSLQEQAEVLKEDKSSAKENLEKKNEEVSDLSQDVQEAESVLNQKEEELSNATSSYDDANAAYDSLDENVKSLGNQLDQAISEKEQMEDTIQYLSDRISTLEMELTGLDDDSSNQLLAEIDSLKSECELLKQIQENHESQISSLNEQKESAESALYLAEEVMNQAKQQLSTDQESLYEAKAFLEEAKTDYQNSVEKLDALREAYDSAVLLQEENAVEYESLVKSALEQVEEAQTNLTNAIAKLELLEGTSSEVVESAQAAQSQLDSESIGFYEWLIANDVIADTPLMTVRRTEIVKDEDGIRQTGEQIVENLNAPETIEQTIAGTTSRLDHSVTLENLKKAVALIDRTNEIRALNGKSELKVDLFGTVYAIKAVEDTFSTLVSSSQLSHSVVIRWYPKLGYTSANENLSLGYSDPTDGWYLQEGYMLANYIMNGGEVVWNEDIDSQEIVNVLSASVDGTYTYTDNDGNRISIDKISDEALATMGNALNIDQTSYSYSSAIVEYLNESSGAGHYFNSLSEQSTATAAAFITDVAISNKIKVDSDGNYVISKDENGNNLYTTYVVNGKTYRQPVYETYDYYGLGKNLAVQQNLSGAMSGTAQISTSEFLKLLSDYVSEMQKKIDAGAAIDEEIEEAESEIELAKQVIDDLIEAGVVIEEDGSYTVTEQYIESKLEDYNQINQVVQELSQKIEEAENFVSDTESILRDAQNQVSQLISVVADSQEAYESASQSVSEWIETVNTFTESMQTLEKNLSDVNEDISAKQKSIVLNQRALDEWNRNKDTLLTDIESLKTSLETSQNEQKALEGKIQEIQEMYDSVSDDTISVIETYAETSSHLSIVQGQYDEALSSFESLRASLMEAKTERDALASVLNQKSEELESVISALENAKVQVSQHEDSKQSASEKYASAVITTESAKESLLAAQKEYSDCEDTYIAAKQFYESLKEEYSQLSQKVETLRSNVNTAFDQTFVAQAEVDLFSEEGIASAYQKLADAKERLVLAQKQYDLAKTRLKEAGDQLLVTDDAYHVSAENKLLKENQFGRSVDVSLNRTESLISDVTEDVDLSNIVITYDAADGNSSVDFEIRDSIEDNTDELVEAPADEMEQSCSYAPYIYAGVLAVGLGLFVLYRKKKEEE